MSKFIFLDIDGTLLSYNAGIPASTKEALYLAKQNGHKLFIATGRPKSEISSTITEMGFDGYIYSAGAQVEADDKLIHKQKMDPILIDELVTFMTKNNIGFILEGHRYAYCDPDTKAFFCEMMEDQNLGMDKNNFLLIDDYLLENTEIEKISIFTRDLDHFTELQDYINNQPDTVLLIHDGHNDGLFHGEVLIKGITKATGINHLLTHYSKSIKDTISFGDSVNDMEMITATHLGISMGNGSETLKKIADDVTDTVDNDGIYKAFAKYNLI